MKKIDTSTWTEHEIKQGFAIRRNKGGGYFALMLNGDKADAGKIIAGKQMGKLNQLKAKQRQDILKSNTEFDSSMKGLPKSITANMHKERAEGQRNIGIISGQQAKFMQDIADGKETYSEIYNYITEPKKDKKLEQTVKQYTKQEITKKIKAQNAQKSTYDEVLSQKLKEMDKYDLERMSDDKNRTISNIANVEKARRYEENKDRYLRQGQDYYKHHTTEAITEDVKNIGTILATGNTYGEAKDRMQEQFESGRAYLQQRFKEDQKKKARLAKRKQENNNELQTLMKKKEAILNDPKIDDETAYIMVEKIDNEIANKYSNKEISKAESTKQRSEKKYASKNKSERDTLDYITVEQRMREAGIEFASGAGNLQAKANKVASGLVKQKLAKQQREYKITGSEDTGGSILVFGGKVGNYDFIASDGGIEYYDKSLKMNLNKYLNLEEDAYKGKYGKGINGAYDYITKYAKYDVIDKKTEKKILTEVKKQQQKYYEHK